MLSLLFSFVFEFVILLRSFFNIVIGISLLLASFVFTKWFLINRLCLISYLEFFFDKRLFAIYHLSSFRFQDTKRNLKINEISSEFHVSDYAEKIKVFQFRHSVRLSARPSVCLSVRLYVCLLVGAINQKLFERGK